MAKRRVTVETTTTLPAALRLDRAELEVLTRYQAILLKAFRDAWVGWKYEGRPADKPRLVSHDAWTAQVETRGDRPVLLIQNAARSVYGHKPYVAHVARSKGATPEWLLVLEQVNREILPRLSAELAQAFGAAHEGRPRKVRTTGGETVTLELEL